MNIAAVENFRIICYTFVTISQTETMERKAVFPGTFDPFTLGHKIVTDQALKLFDRVTIAVGYNPAKRHLLSPEARVRLIRDIYRDNPNVSVIEYEGLTVEMCRRERANFILRGIRNSVDFEFERNMMQVNKSLLPDVETIFLFTPPEYVSISSSIVREILENNGNPDKFMPEGIDLKKYLTT